MPLPASLGAERLEFPEEVKGKSAAFVSVRLRPLSICRRGLEKLFSSPVLRHPRAQVLFFFFFTREDIFFMPLLPRSFTVCRMD